LVQVTAVPIVTVSVEGEKAKLARLIELLAAVVDDVFVEGELLLVPEEHPTSIIIPSNPQTISENWKSPRNLFFNC
jgi:hypothetical protein